MNRDMVEALYRHKDKGAFKGTFMDERGSACAHCQWSCTELRYVPENVRVVDFTDGDYAWGLKDDNEISIRPVRAELRL